MNDPHQAGKREIVSYAFGDVNGDGIKDYVFLTAVKPKDAIAPYAGEIKLNIQDGATKNIYTIPLEPEGNSGYSPTLFLGDFTGDGIKDILISIDSGGSGALTLDYIYSFVHNRARKLFDFNQYNEQNQYKVNFLDHYRVKIESPATGQFYLVDISSRGADYLSQIYREDGTLKEPVEGMSDGVSGFYPVDMDKDGVFEIQAFQGISGLYHADSFGYMINTLKWDGQKFAIWQQWLAIFGANENK